MSSSQTPEEIAKAKKDYRQAKRRRQKIEKRGLEKVLKDERDHEEGRKRGHQKILAKAATLVMPDDCKLSTLAITHPHIHKDITSKGRQAQKSDDPLTLRAIFFNGLDKGHSFDKEFRTTRANCAMVQQALALEQKVSPTILVPYALACQEYKYTPNAFIYREAYIKIWKGSLDDVHKVSQSQHRAFNKLVRDLEAALDEAADTADDGKNISKMAGELKAALSDAVGDELDEADETLDEPGEKMDVDIMGGDEMDLDENHEQMAAQADLESMVANPPKLESMGDKERLKAHDAWIDGIVEALSAKTKELKRIKSADDPVVKSYHKRTTAFIDLSILHSEAYQLGFEQYDY